MSDSSTIYDSQYISLPFVLHLSHLNTSFALLFCLLPVETFVHAMLGSGFPVALQGRNTSFSASTDMLAVVTVMMLGFTPPPPAPTSHGKGGAAVARRELILPARFQQRFFKIYNSLNIPHIPDLSLAFISLLLHTYLQQATDFHTEAMKWWGG